MVLPFLGPFLSGRGLGAVAVGLVTAAFSLAKLGYAPFLGRWVDRGGWVPGMLSLHVVFSLAAALVVIRAENPWVLGVAFLAVGLGYGTVLPLVEAAVLERPPLKGYGFVRLWGSVGFIAFAGVSAAVIRGGRLGWFPILLVGSLVALGLVAATLEGESRPSRRGTAPSERVAGSVWVLLIILTLHQVAHGPYYAFFSIHLGEHGVGAGPIAALWSWRSSRS